MRLIIALVAVIAIAAGCGARANNPETTFAEWVEALEQEDGKRVTELLSPQVRAQVRPEQRREFVRIMRQRAGGADAANPVLVARVGPHTVVAARKESAPGAYAAVLIEHEDAWHVVPYGVDIFYGLPADAAGRRAAGRLTFSINPHQRVDVVEAWIDDDPVDVRPDETAVRDQSYAAKLPDLDAGGHIAVVYARAGDRAHAIAWSFTSN